MHQSCYKYIFLFMFFFRGDIVIAKSPYDPNMNICKRVIGLEGDKICTSAPSDVFRTHTYVSMNHQGTSLLKASCCDYLLY